MVSRRAVLFGAGAAGATVLAGALVRKFTNGNRRIKLVFHFENHAEPSDEDKFEKLIKKHKPHVVVIERGASSTKESRDVEKLLYTVGITPTASQRESQLKFVEILKRNGKPNLLVIEKFSGEDAKRLNSNYDEATTLGGKAWDYFDKGDAQSALATYKKALDLYAGAMHERNQHIKRQLENLHSEISASHPHLKDVRNLTVLVRYGISHAPIYHYARRLGFKQVEHDGLPSASFIESTSPYTVYSAKREWNLQREEDNHAIAKYLVAQILADTIMKIRGVESSTAFKFAHLAAKNIDANSFSDLSRRVKASVSTGKPLEEAYAEVFSKHHIPLPNSKGDVTSFLAREERR